MAVGITSFLHRIGRRSLSLDEGPHGTSASLSSSSSSSSSSSLATTARRMESGQLLTTAAAAGRHSLDDRKLGNNNNNKNNNNKRRLSSPKFFAKVTWVDTLSQLAGLVPLGQISVPEPVYR
ncbi:hypothetical protein IWW48_004364 [Coemansia sp. RSA 1200]|nr:hypothetical protein IWW48_004364 [Coemansia sp. RSA 1200]